MTFIIENVFVSCLYVIIYIIYICSDNKIKLYTLKHHFKFTHYFFELNYTVSWFLLVYFMYVQVLIDKSVKGWKEIEYEVVRDLYDKLYYGESLSLLYSVHQL